MKSLGKLQQVEPRGVWPHEAADFTPWLARPENVALLSQAVGLELEVENIEVSVGPYSADIVARDTSSGDYVVSSGELTETKQLQLEFWEQVREALQATNRLPALQTPRPQYWYDVALGRTGIHLSCFADTWGKRVGVRVLLHGRHGGAKALALLLLDREAIEGELGFALEWDPYPEKSIRSIVVDRPALLEQRGAWSPHIEWLVKTVLMLRTVFAPRILALDLSDDSTDDEGLILGRWGTYPTSLEPPNCFDVPFTQSDDIWRFSRTLPRSASA